MSKKYTKSQSLQGEAAPGPQSAGAGFKTWGHQHGNAAHQGEPRHQGERYEGDAASATSPSGSGPRYQTKGDAVKSGPAPTSEAQRVPGSDAAPNIGQNYDGKR